MYTTGLDALAGQVCLLVASPAIGIPVSAVVLRGVCTLHNRFSRTENQVPMPTFMLALAIIGIAYFAQIALGLLLGVVIGGAALGAGISAAAARTIAIIVAIPYTLFVHTWVLEGMLPTTFGRAMFITSLQLLSAYSVLGGLVALIVLAAR
jgi:hypothetical protein